MAITKPILLDETGKQLLQAMNRQNAILEVMAADKLAELTTNLEEIHRLVREGIAHEVLEIGDQINVPWSDGTTNYVMPFDIVHFGEVELADGEKVPGMYLQSHYALPAGVPYDIYEAFYLCPNGLAAGTYNVTTAQAWSKIPKASFQFTLTKPVPAGGCLCGFERMADTDSWQVKSYADMKTTTPIETVAVSQGEGGTSLGVMPYNKATDDINSMYRTGYGYHRWSQSNLRQYLNSDAAAGGWWTAQNAFDRAPSEVAKQGFMKGFNEDFLKILGKVKVTTALNTYEGHASDRETTVDTFFLPSLEQIYCTPQLAGAEGEYWEYWKRALGIEAPAATHPSVYEAYKTYALNAKTSAQACWLRSANRGGINAWYQYSGGGVGSGNPYFAFRCAPACVIC